MFSEAWEAVGTVQGVLYGGWQEAGWPQSEESVGVRVPALVKQPQPPAKGDRGVNPAPGRCLPGVSSQRELWARSKGKVG